MATADTLILNVAALLPTFVASHYSSVSSLSVGLLMACYPIAFLVTAPFIGSHMENMGRKNCVVSGMLVMSLATLTFGLASFANTAEMFFIISALARVLQGVADASVSVAIPGIITMVYPDKQEKYLGFYNMSIGVGTCAGPVLGSLIYSFIGYNMTFVCFSVLIFTSFVIAVVMVPSKLNFSNARLMDVNYEQKSISYF
jgi:DHA3 family macrolide efflux protein-like MFS transporter